MNKLPGTITGLEMEGGISLVEVDVQGERFISLVLESAGTAGYLAPGNPILVLCKESEVSIAVGSAEGLSIRNRIPCVIRSLAQGKLLTHLVLDFRGLSLDSLISARAAGELGLRPGLAVTALIKATEVSLAEPDARF